MKKVRIAMAVLMTATLLFGCGSKSGATSTFAPTQNSIFVRRDGTVSSALVEVDDKSYYDQAELKTFIEEWITTYNTEQGSSGVTLASCTLKDGMAAAVFDYASGADLCSFTQASDDQANQAGLLEVSTISDGLVQGKVSDGTWKAGKDGSSVSLDTVIKQGDLNLVTMDGAVTLQTEGKIQYYSGAVTMVDDFTVTSTGGKSYIVFK